MQINIGLLKLAYIRWALCLTNWEPHPKQCSFSLSPDQTHSLLQIKTHTHGHKKTNKANSFWSQLIKYLWMKQGRTLQECEAKAPFPLAKGSPEQGLYAWWQVQHWVCPRVFTCNMSGQTAYWRLTRVYTNKADLSVDGN